MQSYSPNVPGVGHQHTYVHHGMLRSLFHIYRSEGITGLWRGADAAMVRTGIGSAVQLSTYDQSKRLLLKTGLFDDYHGNGAGHLEVHFCASLITSFFVCLAMNPFDVASTRMVSHICL
jgi:solute carrier family 25, member 34/35